MAWWAAVTAQIIATLFVFLLFVETSRAADGSPLPDPSGFSSVGWLLLTVAAMAAAANQITGFFLNFKKIKRGEVFDTASADARYASSIALHDLRERHEKLDVRVAGIERTTANELRAIHRALGRIEGQLGTAPEAHGG